MCIRKRIGNNYMSINETNFIIKIIKIKNENYFCFLNKYIIFNETL